MKRVAIGSDHAGYDLKEKVKTYLMEKSLEVEDCGTYSTDSVDYPDFAHSVTQKVNSNAVEFGILLCGSGNGINISANKAVGIRSALAWNAEVAGLAKMHNDANVLALPARFISEEEAKEIIDSFLDAEFEGGRHQNRINKIE